MRVKEAITSIKTEDTFHPRGTKIFMPNIRKFHCFIKVKDNLLKVDLHRDGEFLKFLTIIFPKGNNIIKQINIY